MGYKLNGVETGGVPINLILPLVNAVEIPYFIETGTAGSESIIEASKYFKNCFTIELIPDRAIVDTSIENIEWLTGHSVEILPQIIKELNKEKKESGKEHLYGIWWLDAHYSGLEVNTSKYKDCYILEELEAISLCTLDNIIFIDDARLFFGAPPWPLDPRDWATIDDIFLVLRKYFPFNRTTIMDDYIISYPEHLKELLDIEWRKNFHLRYPSYEESIKTQARNVYNEIINYLK